VEYIRRSYSISERRACKLSCLDRSSFRYEPKPDRNATLRIRLRELAEQRRKFGSPRLHVLLQREGHLVNHKRVERLYREEGLSLRSKKRKKRISHLRVVLDRPDKANQHWSMDFVSDSLWNGRRFRVLTIVDDLTRECPALEVDHSLPGLRVTRVLDSLADTRGLPEVITVDNGLPALSSGIIRRRNIARTCNALSEYQTWQFSPGGAHGIGSSLTIVTGVHSGWPDTA
jgi:putative transposase